MRVTLVQPCCNWHVVCFETKFSSWEVFASAYNELQCFSGDNDCHYKALGSKCTVPYAPLCNSLTAHSTGCCTSVLLKGASVRQAFLPGHTGEPHPYIPTQHGVVRLPARGTPENDALRNCFPQDWGETNQLDTPLQGIWVTKEACSSFMPKQHCFLGYVWQGWRLVCTCVQYNLTCKGRLQAQSYTAAKLQPGKSSNFVCESVTLIWLGIWHLYTL